MNLDYKEAKYEQCYFWAKMAIQSLHNANQFFLKHAGGLISGIPLKIDYKSGKAENDAKIASLTKALTMFKSKILEQKKALLGKLITTHNDSLKESNRKALKLTILPEAPAPNNLKNPIHIKIEEPNEVFYLIRKLIQSNIICKFDEDLSCIIIYNFLKSNVKSIKEALIEWKQFIEHKQTELSYAMQQQCSVPSPQLAVIKEELIVIQHATVTKEESPNKSIPTEPKPNLSENIPIPAVPVKKEEQKTKPKIELKRNS